MSPVPTPPPKPGDLQFDRVDTPGGGEAKGPAGALRCANCGALIETQYYHVGDHTVCETCKRKIEGQLAAAMARGKGAGAMMRAVFLGLGAAILGAAIYYGVIAATNLEIGIIAILIGYMVGWAVRKGSRGVGGRRYQVLAVLLTYFAVGLAYAPIAFQEVLKKKSEAVSVVARSDTSMSETPTAADTATAASAPTGAGTTALALLIVLGLVLALPVMAVVGSMPSGILSAIIIGVGLRQAWRMTASTGIAITGPFKVAGARPAGG